MQDLSQAIVNVADNPTVANRDAFYAAFLDSWVGVRVPSILGSVPSGNYTTKSDQIGIPRTTLSDGSSMLLVAADVDELADDEKSTFLGFSPIDILKLAIENRVGIIVNALFQGRKSWAAIPYTDTQLLFQKCSGSATPESSSE